MRAITEARLQQAKAALQAGLAKQNEAQTNVSLTRATGAANVQQAGGDACDRLRSEVESSRAGAASSAEPGESGRVGSFNCASKPRAGSRPGAGGGSRSDAR